MESFTNKTLLSLAALSLVGLVCGSSRSAGVSAQAELSAEATETSKAQRSKLKLNYALVYALVMMADWLQGPYIFSLYRDEFGLSLHVVALLFVLGFASAALFAPVVGRCADSFGRKRLCLVFVAAYALSCLVKFWSFLPTLFLGRLLGGLATSILFSSFESWLITSAHNLNTPSIELSTYLGRLTFVNGAVAVLSGLVADVAVAKSGTFKSPFAVSAALLVVAGSIIAPTWKENFGGAEQDRKASMSVALAVLWNNGSLLMLLLVNTVFEVVTYCWVFLWVAIVQDTQQPTDEPLPLGRMFSSFMAAMSLGSLVYNLALKHLGPSSSVEALSVEVSAETDERAPLLAATATAQPASTSSSRSITFHSWFAFALLILAGTAHTLAAQAQSTKLKFLCFLAYEGTLGLFYPIIANLRASMFPDECRATLTALFRLPFNVLVTVALVSGLENHRETFLSASGAALLASSLVAAVIALRSSRASKTSR